MIGINDYFGWYPGPSGLVFDRTKLPAYLDSVRACYPKQAVMVTEFGAEANRDGPVEEKGTWAFQQDFINFHLATYATKSWLSGAVYWALNEFKVRPGWEGGNPRPNPPLHQKGLLKYGDLSRKPAWSDLQRNYAATKQFGLAGRPSERGLAAAAAQVRAGSAGRGRRGARGGLRSRRRSCERRRIDGWTASGSGRPPDGEVLGFPGRRSLPPPPPSSSSGGFQGCVVSERRNITNSATPSATAIRWSVPKMSISSASGDIRIERYPQSGPSTTTSLAWPPVMAGSDHQSLEVTARPVEGSRSTRRLRKQGLVPGVVYGGGVEPQTFAVDALTLRATLAHAGAVLDLKVGDAAATPVIVKDVQNHPVRGEAIHLDLLRVDMSKPIQSVVVLELLGGDDRPASARAACSARRRASSTSRPSRTTSRTRSRTTSPAWR